MSNPDSADYSLFDNLAMPVLVVHGGGGIDYGNPAARYFWRFYRYRLEEAALPQLFGAESSICRHLRRAIEEQSSVTVEPYRFQQENGDPPLILRVQIDPVLLPNRPVERAVVLLWDLTQRQRLENRAVENRLMDSIGLMVKRLAHELQNPLSGIKGATQLLARKLAEWPEYGVYPAIILKELERLERLVKNLLLQGGEQTLRKSYFNLHQLLDTVIWFQENADSKAVFERDYDPSLPELYADKDKMHQVFLNLIRNAAEAGGEAGGEAGPITVRTRMAGPWQQNEKLFDSGATLFSIEVEDRGAGVAEEHMDNLFTPFFTTKKNGSGLGLSISFQIVRAHQGFLQCRPGRGKGAIFSVTLPLVEQN